MRLFCRLAKLVETRQPRRSPAAAARRRSELAIVSVCPKSPATNCGMKRNRRNEKIPLIWGRGEFLFFGWPRADLALSAGGRIQNPDISPFAARSGKREA